MIEVTQNNFNYIYPQVALAVESCDFISIDTEFSGLCLSDEVKPSLFDSITNRYDKQRKSVTHFSLLQFGLTTFKGNTVENKYDVASFNFHIRPFSICSSDPILSFQTSTIEFHNKHNFDFHKCFTESIPYLNSEQEQQLIEDLKQGLQMHHIDSFDFKEGTQSVCSLVASWLTNEKTEQYFTLSLEEGSAIPLNVIHKELRRRFYQIWTSTNQFNQILVQRVLPDERKCFEDGNKEKEEAEKKQQIMDAVGFTQVFRLLERMKKPMIGHNMFLDLLFMYDKFHKPLPGSYSKFKQDIHRMFPLVFDTKHLYHILKKDFEILKVTTVRALEDLHDLINSQKFLGLSLLNPSIHKVVSENTADMLPNAAHHAGFDSFQCGCVFLRLCHLKHFSTLRHTEMNAVPFRNYLSTSKSHANRINVIRATINYIRLDGEDPQSDRPPVLHVSVVSSKELFTPNQMSLWFSVYGAVDIRMIGSTEAVVATSHYMVARDILYSFKKHPMIRVTRYKFWQHSSLGKCIWWSSFLAVSGSCMLLLYDTLRE